jgi:hypothetical protein
MKDFIESWGGIYNGLASIVNQIIIFSPLCVIILFVLFIILLEVVI